MPFAKSSLGARFEALEFVVWDEGESCAGEAAAMDTHRALTCKKLLAERNRKRHKRIEIAYKIQDIFD